MDPISEKELAAKKAAALALRTFTAGIDPNAIQEYSTNPSVQTDVALTGAMYAPGVAPVVGAVAAPVLGYGLGRELAEIYNNQSVMGNPEIDRLKDEFKKIDVLKMIRDNPASVADIATPGKLPLMAGLMAGKGAKGFLKTGIKEAEEGALRSMESRAAKPKTIIPGSGKNVVNENTLAQWEAFSPGNQPGVNAWKEKILNGENIPPIITYKGGVLDGHHRLKAYRELGIKDVPVKEWKRGEPMDFKTILKKEEYGKHSNATETAATINDKTPAFMKEQVRIIKQLDIPKPEQLDTIQAISPDAREITRKVMAGELTDAQAVSMLRAKINALKSLHK